MGKTLYVSDLDGTLLKSDETTSEYTNKTINNLVEKGMLFSYATARSYTTAKKVTAGLNAKIPIIAYNGTFIVNNGTGEIMLANYFDDSIKKVILDLIENGVQPIVYRMHNGIEEFAYISDKISPGTNKFLETRKGDDRECPVKGQEDLLNGETFHITCIEDKEKLQPLYEKYKDQYHCVFYVDMYTEEHWFEIMPKESSKANAIKQLKEYLDCDKVVVFGDHANDKDMFERADEAYAVENAIDELKQIATGIIDSNDEDGVAKWLETNID